MTPSRATSLPILGTWKMTSCDASHPDLPHPAAATSTFAERDGAIEYRAETVWSDGRSTTTHIVFHMDGRWCPVEGSPLADTASVEALAGGAFEVHMKKGDVAVGLARTTVAADGRSISTRWEIAGPGGMTLVWNTASSRQ